MKKFIVLFSLIFYGCASSSPHNPLKRKAERLWWQADTASINSNSPWEKFLDAQRTEDPCKEKENILEPPAASKKEVDDGLKQPIIEESEAF
jgi:hypothetical protein